MSARPAPFNEYRIEGDTAILVLKAAQGRRKGQVTGEAIIDAADLPDLLACGRPWYSLSDAGYVARWERRDGHTTAILLHRHLMSPAADEVVDHLNRDTLDNRRANLRVCTQRENIRNTRLRRDNTVGVKNVQFKAGRRRPYTVRLQNDGQTIYRCTCRTRNVARITASLARREHYGADYQ